MYTYYTCQTHGLFVRQWAKRLPLGGPTKMTVEDPFPNYNIIFIYSGA